MSEHTQEQDSWLGGDAPSPEKRRSQPGPEPAREDRANRPPRGDAPGGRPSRAPRRTGMRESDRVRREAESGTWRLFVAVELPPAAIEEIGSFINEMPPGPAANVRWTPRDNVHLTLQFLGDTDPKIVGEVQRKIAEEAANTTPMLLQLGETGAFPEFRNPRILWVGLTGDVRRLVQLQGRIEGAMAAAFEIAPERRRYTPHITVGRAARDLTSQQAGDIGFSWRRTRMPRERTQVPVSEVTLFRSRLQMGGPVYEKLFTAKLGGG